MRKINEILRVDKMSSDLSATFQRIANELFTDVTIESNCHKEKKYALWDLEFYLLSQEHQDFYTYAQPLQLTCGNWMKHDSGIDLTFGFEDGQNFFYGGILIRGIIELTNHIPIRGSWYVSQELTGHQPANGEVKVDLISIVFEPIRKNVQTQTAQRKGLKKEKFRLNIEQFMKKNEKVISLENEIINSERYHNKQYRFYCGLGV